MRFRLTLTPLLICSLLMVLTSCKKSLEEERTFNENKSIEAFLSLNKKLFNEVYGVYYVIDTPTYGYQVSKGDTIEFWYRGYTLDGKVFDTNVRSVAKSAKLDTLNRSFNTLVTIAGKGNLIDGLDKGMLFFNQGEQGTILFSSSLGFGDNIHGPVAPWSPLAYDIDLVRVNGVAIQKENNFFESLNLAANDFSKHSSGLYYKYLLSGLNSSPTLGDTIYGWYKGTLPDGTVIEDLGSGNQQIVLLDSNIPIGVRLGFTLTQIGGTTDLVLPSYLGYGNMGNKMVKPYQTLYYQIRLDSIKQ